MKHAQPVASSLQTNADLVAVLRAQLDMPGGKRALAARLGISEHRLTQILRGSWPVPNDVAERLGFRRVERFEPIGS